MVDAEGGGDRAVLGEGAQAAAGEGPLQRDVTAADEQQREREGDQPEVGRAIGPRCSALVPYGFSAGAIWRKSAVQIRVATSIAIISSPKLTSSELNSAMSNRS